MFVVVESSPCREAHISTDLVRMDRDEPSASDSPREYYRQRMGLGHDHDLLDSNHCLTICFVDSADCRCGGSDLQREMLWVIWNVGIHSAGRMLTAEGGVKVHLNEHGSGTHLCSIRWRPSFAKTDALCKRILLLTITMIERQY